MLAVVLIEQRHLCRSSKGLCSSRITARAPTPCSAATTTAKFSCSRSCKGDGNNISRCSCCVYFLPAGWHAQLSMQRRRERFKCSNSLCANRGEKNAAPAAAGAETGFGCAAFSSGSLSISRMGRQQQYQQPHPHSHQLQALEPMYGGVPPFLFAISRPFLF